MLRPAERGEQFEFCDDRVIMAALQQQRQPAMTEPKSLVHGVALSALATLLAGTTIELVLCLSTAFSRDREEGLFVPSTFFSVWAVAALLAIAWVIRRCGIRLMLFYPALMIGSIVVALTWLALPSSWTLQGNYQGISSRYTLESYESGPDGRRAHSAPLRVGLLYRADDPELQRAIADGQERNEEVRSANFVFWQTGLALGYEPFAIDGYSPLPEFWERLPLYATVGPVVVVEATIRGAIKCFPILILLQIIWFARRRTLLLFDKEA